MMSSLFSSFDPCSSSSLFNNWLSMFLVTIFVPSVFWSINSRYTFIFKKFLFTLFSELKLLISSHLMKGSTLIFISLILFIMMNNFMGLFPYIFTASSHLVVALSMALPLWLTFMIYGWILNTKHMFAHLVPLSTPNILMPFMVLIESISNIIRPGTLTVRLSANMIAGHLLLTLLGNQTAHSASSILVFLLVLTQILLLTLESAVALIQAYVFTVLSTLYSSEIN